MGKPGTMREGCVCPPRLDGPNQPRSRCWLLLASRFSPGTPSSTEQGHRSTGEAPVPQEHSMAQRSNENSEIGGAAVQAASILRVCSRLGLQNQNCSASGSVEPGGWTAAFAREILFSPRSVGALDVVAWRPGSSRTGRSEGVVSLVFGVADLISPAASLVLDGSVLYEYCAPYRRGLLRETCSQVLSSSSTAQLLGTLVG